MMKSIPRFPIRAMSLVAAFVATVFVVIAGGVSPAQALSPRQSSKVTICHRTHAVTNPYRRITVNASSIITNGSNGHDAVTHNPYYGSGTVDARPVFDPTFTYPNNQKQWQDIIPSFTYEQGGSTHTFAGLNWDDAGKAIYYGLTYNSVNFEGYCGQQGAAEFYQSELEQWKTDNPGYTERQLKDKKREIVDDIKDQEAEGDPPAGRLNNPNYDPTNLPAKPKQPAGPHKPPALTDLMTTIQEDNDTKEPSDPINQALAGVVWKDMNENGIQDNDEETFDVVGIQIVDPVTNLPVALPDLNILPVNTTSTNQVFTFAQWNQRKPVYSTTNTLITVHTVNGYFEIPSIPEGEWKVVVITPEGWTYTFDSSGGGDGKMPGTYVPRGGVGFAWAGLVQGSGTVGGGSGSDGSGTDGSTLSATGVSASEVYVSWVAVLTLLGGIALITLRRRHRR